MLAPAVAFSTRGMSLWSRGPPDAAASDSYVKEKDPAARRRQMHPLE
jgi:hypothetical protein